MIVATIKKLDGTYLDHGNFVSEEAAMIWFSPRIDQGIYGQKHVPAQYQTVTVVIQEALLDEQGEEISPAVTEVHQELVKEEIPAAFEITFAEPTLTQQEISAQNLEFLSSTDWQVMRHRDQLDAGATPSLTEEQYQQLLAQRQVARDAII
jgi:hypothetical protein